MAVSEINDQDVVYYMRDIKKPLVDAWTKAFSEYPETVKVSSGDIFQGAPAVDAIVSPAQSFGFMDGGIDYVYTKHFGVQMQERLQKVIREEYDGEVLVGQAVIIPAYGEDGRDESKDWSKCNEGVKIKYLISAPTMRTPLNVSDTANAYLAFRAVILAVRKHNKREGVEPIQRVLIPGLGTAVGRMPGDRCAWQMLQAYETFTQNKHEKRVHPTRLWDLRVDHDKLVQYGGQH